MTIRQLVLVVTLLGVVVTPVRGEAGPVDLDDWKHQNVSALTLLKWTLWGQGKAFKVGDAVCLQEDDESKGVMLISPESYGENVVVTYKALALTPATVIATLLSASEPGAENALRLPNSYDGSIGVWLSQKENYFFAFKNAPHGLTPFVKKNPSPGEKLGAAPKNVMVAGLFYDIEVGREGTRLWLSINGKNAFDMQDESPLSGGHIGLRLRGTAGFKAALLVKDLKIHRKQRRTD